MEIIVVPLVVLTLYFVIRAIIAVMKSESQNKKPEEEIQKRRQQLFEKFEQQRREEEYKEKEREEKYGACSKVIRFPVGYRQEPLRIYETSKVVIIQDREYHFNDIMGYELADDDRTITSGGSIKSDTIGTIGRAGAGALIAGGVGAIVGGMTGGHSVRPSYSVTLHDFYLFIKVRNIQNPIIKLRVGDNHDLAIEIASIFDIILQDREK